MKSLFGHGAARLMFLSYQLSSSVKEVAMDGFGFHRLDDPESRSSPISLRRLTRATIKIHLAELLAIVWLEPKSRRGVLRLNI